MVVLKVALFVDMMVVLKAVSMAVLKDLLMVVLKAALIDVLLVVMSLQLEVLSGNYALNINENLDND
jgi:hypothetical protein